MGIGAALGNAGERPSVELNGQKYYCSFVVQRLKARYRQWAIHRALQPFAFLESEGKGKVSQAFIDRCVREVLDRAEKGHYDFGPAALASLNEGNGLDSVVFLVSLLFDCSDDVAMDLLLQKRTETLAAVEQVVRDSFPPPV